MDIILGDLGGRELFIALNVGDLEASLFYSFLDQLKCRVFVIRLNKLAIFRQDPGCELDV